MKTCKLFKNIVWGMTLCGALCTTSCTSFDELNTDPTRMDEVNPGTLLNPILYENIGLQLETLQQLYLRPDAMCRIYQQHQRCGMVVYDGQRRRRHMDYLL